MWLILLISARDQLGYARVRLVCFLFCKSDCLACDFRKLSLANCDVRSFADGERWLHYTKKLCDFRRGSTKKRKERKEKKLFIITFFSFLKLLVSKTIYFFKKFEELKLNNEEGDGFDWLKFAAKTHCSFIS